MLKLIKCKKKSPKFNLLRCPPPDQSDIERLRENIKINAETDSRIDRICKLLGYDPPPKIPTLRIIQQGGKN